VTHVPALLGAVPPLSRRQLLSTTVDPLPIALLLGALALYLWGVVRANRIRPHPWPAGRTAAFVGGVVTTAIALLSVVGVYDDELFWDHMVQHLLLIMVAAPLFAASSPVALAWRASTGRVHGALGGVLRSRPMRILGHPVTAFAAYALVIPLTHLTVFMTWVLETDGVHHAEHLAFLVVGFLFWRQNFGRDPGGRRFHPALKALYLFLALPVDTFVGLTLSLESREVFPAEAAVHRTWGPSLLTDLHWGGVIMWVGGDILMMLAFVPVVVQWVRLDERAAARSDRELEVAFPTSGASPAQPTVGFALGRYAGSAAPRPSDAMRGGSDQQGGSTGGSST